MPYSAPMRLLSFIAVLAVPAFAQGSIFPDPETKKAAKHLEASTISDDVRSFLKMKMKNHSKEMKELSLAVAMVQLSEVQRLAQDIANQPRIDASAGPAMKLPPRFFELQNELKKNAQALADAGKANEMSGSLQKYTLVVETCMGCHAAFRAMVQQK